MIVYYCCLVLVQLQSNVHFQMTVEHFPLSWTTEFLTVTFRDEHLSLIVVPLLLLQCNNFTCPIIHRTLQLPAKPTMVYLASTQSKSPQITQIRGSISLSSSLLPAPRVEMLSTPILRLSPCVRSLRASLHCTSLKTLRKQA